MKFEKTIYLFFALVGLVMMVLAMSQIREIRNINFENSYCEQKGYEGVTNMRMFDRCHRCYKYIMHESGVGTKKIYSGCLNEG